ncbi:choice-of-anchor P family protein [Streptomyces sp. NPDC021212]|uniref:choice-of-anchor P family protein n=1 Tax=Streptomyces sp. NPDC021212 TaxID=3365118 RepID=UPI0037A757C5
MGYDGKKKVSGLLAQTAGKRITTILASRDSSFALTDGGQLIAAGDSPYEEASGLAAKTAGKHITAVAATWNHGLALTADGEVIGTGFDSHKPISGLIAQTAGKRITAIAAGACHSLALTADGQVVGAGLDGGKRVSGLIAQTAGKRITAIAAGGQFSLALTADGQIIAAGENRFGLVTELPEKTRGKKVIAIAAGEETALALIQPQPRMMTGRAAVAGLPQASDVNELGASFIRPSFSPASQHTTVTADSLQKGESQSVQVSTGDSSVTTTVSGGVRTVRGTVTAASAQAGDHAPLVVDLTAMSLDVTVTSTDGERPSPAVRLTFNEITVGGRSQPTSPAPNTTIPFDGGGKAVLNRQQPSDTGIQVTAVTLFDNSGREVARLGHVDAYLPADTPDHR